MFIIYLIRDTELKACKYKNLRGVEQPLKVRTVVFTAAKELQHCKDKTTSSYTKDDGIYVGRCNHRASSR